MTPETTYLAVLGKVLAQKRKEKRWDQAKIAIESGINRSSWSRLENGEAAPDTLQIHRIAKIFNTTPQNFLSEVQEKCDYLEKQGVKIHMQKKIPKSGNKAGWFLFGAALGALITAAASKGGDSQEKNKEK